MIGRARAVAHRTASAATRRPSLALALVLVLVLASAWTAADARASEPTVDECLKASEAGQRLRGAGHDLRARKSWETCTAAACPALVRQDCAGWIADIDRSLPSVVLIVRDAADRDVQNASITVDGAREPVTGRALLLDPGEHALVAEAPGFARLEQRLLVNTAEKNRLVVLRLASTAGEAGAAGPPAGTLAVDSPAPQASAIGSPPTAAWILGGVGVASAGASLLFGLAARHDLSAASDAPCAPARSCDDSIRRSSQTKLVVADVLLGASVVAIAAGVWVWLSARPAAASPAKAPASTVRAGVTGSRLVVEGAFW
jgi:hypothetical protein